MFDWSGKNADKSGKSQGILISCVSGNPEYYIIIIINSGLQVMSSPMLKRRGSRLSSGSGSESNSLVTSSWLDLDLSGEHHLPGIQEEEEPVEMLREMQATLTNEIQVLQV